MPAPGAGGTPHRKQGIRSEVRALWGLDSTSRSGVFGCGGAVRSGYKEAADWASLTASRLSGWKSFRLLPCPLTHCGSQIVRVAGVSVQRLVRSWAGVRGDGVWFLWPRCAVDDTERDGTRLKGSEGRSWGARWELASCQPDRREGGGSQKAPHLSPLPPFLKFGIGGSQNRSYGK